MSNGDYRCGDGTLCVVHCSTNVVTLSSKRPMRNAHTQPLNRAGRRISVRPRTRCTSAFCEPACWTRHPPSPRWPPRCPRHDERGICRATSSRACRRGHTVHTGPARGERIGRPDRIRRPRGEGLPTLEVSQRLSAPSFGSLFPIGTVAAEPVESFAVVGILGTALGSALRPFMVFAAAEVVRIARCGASVPPAGCHFSPNEFSYGDRRRMFASSGLPVLGLRW